MTTLNDFKTEKEETFNSSSLRKSPEQIKEDLLIKYEDVQEKIKNRLKLTFEDYAVKQAYEDLIRDEAVKEIREGLK
jgi:hypothetical protein